MTNPTKVIVAVLLAAFLYGVARADYIDLRGSAVVSQGQCKHTDSRIYLCVAVTKDEKVYNILLDEKGEVAIYLITNGKAELIWARSSV